MDFGEGELGGGELLDGGPAGGLDAFGEDSDLLPGEQPGVIGFTAPSWGRIVSAGMASVAGAGVSPTKMVKPMTTMRSVVAAAWANWELYWMLSTALVPVMILARE